MTIKDLRIKAVTFWPQKKSLGIGFLCSFSLLIIVMNMGHPSSQALLLIWLVYMLLYVSIVLLCLFTRSLIVNHNMGPKSVLKVLTLATAPMLLLILSSLGQASIGSVLFLGLFLGLLVFYIDKL